MKQLNNLKDFDELNIQEMEFINGGESGWYWISYGLARVYSNLTYEPSNVAGGGGGGGR